MTRPQQPLPTPPNSISPSLPPHSLRAQLKKAAVGGELDPIDSDLDLHEASAADLDRTGPAPRGGPAERAITPALLATHYLPDVLLAHGPLAIRYIMNYLASAVPGFNEVPPAKARRLVTAALEGKGGSGGPGGIGGVNGDVEFEKVGWGRWSASRRGARGARGTADHNRHSPVSDSSGYLSSGARADSAAAFSHDGRDAVSMLDTEMSLDEYSGAGSASCSEAADDDDVVMGDDPDDATDEEDWGAMGAAALRASGACATTTRAGMTRPPHQRPNFFQPVYNDHQRAPARAPAAGAAGAGGRSVSAPQPRPLNIDFSALGGGASDAQEREAVEALLSLGTV